MEGTEAPVPRLERSAGIDFARGMALLGIILVNARFFFLPMGCALGDGPLLRALNAFPGQQVDVFIEAAQRNAEATLAPR
jgi:uncharacterized membrane protein YeiB